MEKVENWLRENLKFIKLDTDSPIKNEPNIDKPKQPDEIASPKISASKLHQLNLTQVEIDQKINDILSKETGWDRVKKLFKYE